MNTRSSLRKTLRHQRNQLTHTQQHRAAQKLFARLSRHAWLKQAHHIGIYFPSDGEISPLHFAHWAKKVRKALYLPSINPQTHHMTFKRFSTTIQLKKNVYGIPEPQTWHSTPAYQLDVILMPLVGFDAKGNRLGMGGGYYDRALKNTLKRKTKRIGLAHKLQQVPHIPSARWDVKMHAIATDKNICTQFSRI